MLELIVLGKIPGTTIELTLRGIINVSFILLLFALIIVLLHQHARQTINKAKQIIATLELISL